MRVAYVHSAIFVKSTFTIVVPDASGVSGADCIAVATHGVVVQTMSPELEASVVTEPDWVVDSLFIAPHEVSVRSVRAMSAIRMRSPSGCSLRQCLHQLGG